MSVEGPIEPGERFVMEPALVEGGIPLTVTRIEYDRIGERIDVLIYAKPTREEDDAGEQPFDEPLFRELCVRAP
jgi:hypothetical protein